MFCMYIFFLMCLYSTKKFCCLNFLMFTHQFCYSHCFWWIDNILYCNHHHRVKHVLMYCISAWWRTETVLFNIIIIVSILSICSISLPPHLDEVYKRQWVWGWYLGYLKIFGHYIFFFHRQKFLNVKVKESKITFELH